jgi:hypothetical protein
VDFRWSIPASPRTATLLAYGVLIIAPPRRFRWLVSLGAKFHDDLRCTEPCLTPI